MKDLGMQWSWAFHLVCEVVSIIASGVTNSIFYLSMIVKCPCSVTDTKCKPTVISHPWTKKGNYRLTMLQKRSLTKWNSIQISVIHDNFSLQSARLANILNLVSIVDIWMNSKQVGITWLANFIHMKFHKRITRMTSKYHMTLNTTFSVQLH